LSIEADAKTIKGSKQGFLTGILYLAPHTSSGVMNTCTCASAGCIEACLFTSGRADVFPEIIEARIAKTRMLASDADTFHASLAYDIESLRIRARKRGLKPAVRINGTSDLPKLAHAMAIRFPSVQFYDYTKLPKPWLRQLPNYHLTFSHSETNMNQCIEALQHNISVTVVFALKRGAPMPESWHGYRVFNGDHSDLRFKDPKGCIIGLYAKGRAKKDKSGFVDRSFVSLGSIK
jgi:hypothetical protein